MKTLKPLTDGDGEVRELLMEDIRRFRPMAEGISPTLAAKLGITVKTATPASGKKSGVPTGNAGEYFLMGELLRKGFDAQLADRNTKGYDLLVGRKEDAELRKVQVKTAHAQKWYIKLSDFEGASLNRITIYVLLGKADSKAPVRFFIARNGDVANRVHRQTGWKHHGFMGIKSLETFEDRWEILEELSRSN